jgi:allophanate hydrolase
VAERYWAIRDLMVGKPEALLPVTREIIAGAERYSAVDTFDAFYRLEALKKAAAGVWEEVDLLCLPTAGTIYRIAEVEADPIALNTNLGAYTNFMNLLDLAAVAVPSGFYDQGLPFGVTLAAPAFTDRALLRLAARFHRAAGTPLASGSQPAPEPGPALLDKEGQDFALAVCGAHLEGEPLNHEILALGGRLLRRARTAPCYRLFHLAERQPARPGLLRCEAGEAIEVEIWAVDPQRVGGFLAAVRPPLGIGGIALEDGATVPGFLCEAYATRDALDITQHGGWRAFLAATAGEKDRPRNLVRGGPS